MAPKKKKVVGLIKLQIQAGQANPAPPVGPALGQHGVNIAHMSLSRDIKDGTALVVLNLDGQPAETVLADLRALPDVTSVRLVGL